MGAAEIGHRLLRCCEDLLFLSQATMHLMAKAAVTVYEAAVQNQRRGE
jgi:hypothetical protein